MFVETILALMLSGLSSQPATSTPTQAAQDGTKVKKQVRPDANDILCEKVSVVGSRLTAKTVCMTRLEWQEKRVLDRDFIQRVQFPMGGLRDGG